MNLLFGFSGRIGRGGWWLGQLAIIVICVACVAVIMAILGASGLENVSKENFDQVDGSIVAIICALSVLTTWVYFAITIKRFHDRDKSGFWSLIGFIPYIGGIWLLVECGCLAGTPGGNSYGPSGGGGASLDDDFGGAYSRPERSRTETIAAAPTATASAAPEVSRFVKRGAGGFGRRGL